MNKNSRNGLISLGLAAAAAWYKMTPDQKSNIKNKITGFGNRLKNNLPQDLKNLPQNLRNTANRVSTPVLEEQI